MAKGEIIQPSKYNPKQAAAFLSHDSQLPWEKLAVVSEPEASVPQEVVHVCNHSCPYFGNQAGSRGNCEVKDVPVRTVDLNSICVRSNKIKRRIFPS